MNDYAYEIEKYKRLYEDVKQNFNTLKASCKNLQNRLQISESTRKQQENTITQLKSVIRDLRRERRSNGT